ncbi:MAG: hypothetical protein K2N78_06015 [Oscillospiraceae bacterium]|nr:hypothetical protein [Oscillospiraceae bacterium]
MFGLFKRGDGSQPRKGWPWVLTLGAYPGPRSNPSWSDIENGLRALTQDSDSFLILEQRDPADRKRYWFIQSAVAKQGPYAGQYSLEVGYRKDGKGCLLDRCFPKVEQLFPYYERAFQWKNLDLTGFEDWSDMVQ